MAEGKMLDSILIISFSAAVVALGANELRQRYAADTQTTVSQEQIVRELRGDLDRNQLGFNDAAVLGAQKRVSAPQESPHSRVLRLLGADE